MARPGTRARRPVMPENFILGVVGRDGIRIRLKRCMAWFAVRGCLLYSGV